MPTSDDGATLRPRSRQASSGSCPKMCRVDAWLIALVGGAVGTFITAALGLGARFVQARRETVTHDRLVAEYDEDFASWVSDRTLALRREIAVTTEAMNKKNLYDGGHHANALALLKEQALHQYRDELRRVSRSVTALREREGPFHRYWRRHRPFPSLGAPARAQPILDAWRSTITRHGGSQIEVNDPTRRCDASFAAALHDRARGRESFSQEPLVGRSRVTPDQAIAEGSLSGRRYGASFCVTWRTISSPAGKTQSLP